MLDFSSSQGSPASLMSDSHDAASTKNEEPAADDVGVPEAEPRTAAVGG